MICTNKQARMFPAHKRCLYSIRQQRHMFIDFVKYNSTIILQQDLILQAILLRCGL